MKRFSIFVLFLIVFSFVFVSSQTGLENQLNSLGQQAEQANNNLSQILDTPQKTRNELRVEYLKVEWGKILADKPVIGEIIRFFNFIAPYVNPPIKYVVGIAPALSWYFFLFLIIWLVLVKYYYTFYEVMRDFSTFSDSTSAIIAICFFVILSVLQFFQNVSRYLADLVVKLFGFLGLWWVQLIAVLIFFVFMIIIGKISSQFEFLMKQNKKKNKEWEREMRQESAIKTVEAYAKGLKEGFEDSKK